MAELAFPIAVLDLDGTLLTTQKTISQENQKALKSFQNKGGQIILASGRHPISVAWHARLLGLTGWHIAFDGAVLVHLPALDVPWEFEYIRSLDTESTKEMIDFLVTYTDAQCLAFHEEKLYMQPGERSSFIDQRFPILEGQPDVTPSDWDGGIPIYSGIDWKEKALMHPLHKITVFAQESLKEICEKLSMQNVGKISSSDAKSVEISPIGISKGNTLMHLADRRGFTADQTIAFGDYYNDTALLTAAGMGIAMGNAPEEIQRIAYQVTESNNENGVAKGLKRWAY